MHSPGQASAALRFPVHSIAGRVGTSFKDEHLQAILADERRDRFFEAHAENYMGAGVRLSKHHQRCSRSLLRCGISITPMSLVDQKRLWRPFDWHVRSTADSWRLCAPRKVGRVGA